MDDERLLALLGQYFYAVAVEAQNREHQTGQPWANREHVALRLADHLEVERTGRKEP